MRLSMELGATTCKISPLAICVWLIDLSHFRPMAPPELLSCQDPASAAAKEEKLSQAIFLLLEPSQNSSHP